MRTKNIVRLPEDREPERVEGAGLITLLFLAAVTLGIIALVVML